MKAILMVDEMPEECIDCPCYLHSEEDFNEDCKAMLRPLTNNLRPDWCPLKPMSDEAYKVLMEYFEAMEKAKSIKVRVVRNIENG